MFRDVAGEDWRRTAEDLGWIAIEAARLESALLIFYLELIGAAGPDPEVVGQSWGWLRGRCQDELDLRLRNGDTSEHHDDETIELYRAVKRAIRRADKRITDRSNALHANWGPVWVNRDHQAWVWKRGAAPLITNWTRGAFADLQRRLDASTQEFEAFTARLPR